MSDGTLPLQPRASEFDSIEEYIRSLAEWMIRYVDMRNDHREGSIDTIAHEVANNAADLMRGVDRPGWVHVEMVQLRKDNKALASDNKALRARQTWLLVTAAGALISIVVALTAAIILSGGKP